MPTLADMKLQAIIKNLEEIVIHLENNSKDPTLTENKEDCDDKLQKFKLNLSSLEEANFFESNGVSLDCITSLNVSHCKLRCLPKQLQCFNLINLDISYNNFNYVPEIILYNNGKLKNLNASFNNITNFNTIPKSSASIRNLNLSNNKLEIIPKWLFSMFNNKFEMINLSNNPCHAVSNLTGCYLERLKFLNLSNSNLRNQNLRFITELANLKYLNIGNEGSKTLNVIHDLSLKDFASKSTLEELHFSGLGYSAFSEAIINFKNLKILKINRNYFSWLPDNFVQLKHLQILDLSYNDLITLPENFGNLAKLQELYLSYNALSSLPDSFVNLKDLQILDCYHNDFEENVFSLINQIPSIGYLDLEQNIFLINEQYDNYLEKKDRLRQFLNLSLRENGPREYNTEVLSYSDEISSQYSNYSDEIGYRNFSCNELNDENWDTEIDSIPDDSLLVLPPFKYRIYVKPKPRYPCDIMDPAYFEDSLDDQT